MLAICLTLGNKRNSDNFIVIIEPITLWSLIMMTSEVTRTTSRVMLCKQKIFLNEEEACFTCSLRLIVAMALPSKTSKLALGNFGLNFDITSSAFSITRLPSFLSMVMRGTLCFASIMPKFANAAVLQVTQPHDAKDVNALPRSNLRITDTQLLLK